jgi:glyoxalase/bleomycin resistance protein/dioxygenase superfamily protein
LEPTFTETLQVCVVVRDIDAAMRTYVHEYGIRPWEIYEFNPSTVRNMHERGEPVERSFRLALSRVGGMQWELIQPLDDDSIYAQHLAAHGEGVHHVGVAVADYAATIAALEEKGHEVVFGGEYNGVNFAYLSTDRDLGVLTEIFDAPPGDDQQPDAVYPPS